MSIADVFTGRIAALNRVIRPAAQVLLEGSSTFPERDFLRDYFRNMWLATMIFIDGCFNGKQFSPLRVHARAITKHGAATMVRLVVINHALSFLANPDNVKFIEALDIRRDNLLGHVVECLSFMPEEITVLKDPAKIYREDYAGYVVRWGRLMHTQVIGRSESQEYLDATLWNTCVRISYQAFVDAFQRD